MTGCHVSNSGAPARLPSSVAPVVAQSMDPAYLIFLTALVIGLCFGIRRAKRQAKRKDRGGWFGAGLLVVLTVGLVVAAKTGHESLVWLFGIALMVALPVMLFLAIGSAIGSFIGQTKAVRKRKG